jgi:hypothetical protein
MAKDKKTIRFEPAAWLADLQLQAASAATRGIWINLLAQMWQSDCPGEVTLEIAAMPRMLNCTREEAQAFLNEVSRFEFADCNAPSGGSVTLRNRRVSRVFKRRSLARLRQERFRLSRACNAGNDGACHADVTRVSRGNSLPKLNSLSLSNNEESLKALSLGSTEQSCAIAPKDTEKPNPFADLPCPEPEPLPLAARATLIAEKLYGRAWALDREAKKFEPLLVSLARDVEAGRIAFDRVLAIASEVRLDYNSGRVRHRSAVFSTLVKEAIDRNGKGGSESAGKADT